MSIMRPANLLFIAFLTLFNSCLAAQTLAPVNVVLVPDTRETYGERVIFASILATISNSSALYHQVEREEYDAIQKERQEASRLKDDPYIATVLKGAAVAVEFTLIEYTEIWDSIAVPEVVYSRPWDYSLTIQTAFELKVVDIASSEILDSKRFIVKGTPSKIKKPFVEMQKHFMRINCLGYVRRGVNNATKRFLLKTISPAIPMLRFYNSKGANHVWIAGGKGAAYPGGTKLRLIRESNIMVNGEAVLRQETVGEAVVKKNNSQYSYCLVTKLKAGIDESVLAPYVIPSPQNEVPLVWLEKPAVPK